MARIVFDLDGTLLDSAPDIAAAVNTMLGEEGAAALDLGTVTSFVGNGLPHLVGLVIDHCGLDRERHPDLSRRVLAYYNAASSVRTVPYPGVPETLLALRANGHSLGICTNKPEAPAREVLATLLPDVFDVVIGGDTLPRRKPDPAPLHRTFAALGTGPTIYVGDSEVDAATARAAKVPFLLFTEGYRKTATQEIEHAASFAAFEALPSCIDRVLAATG